MKRRNTLLNLIDFCGVFGWAYLISLGYDALGLIEFTPSTYTTALVVVFITYYFWREED